MRTLAFFLSFFCLIGYCQEEGKTLSAPKLRIKANGAPTPQYRDFVRSISKELANWLKSQKPDGSEWNLEVQPIGPASVMISVFPKLPASVLEKPAANPSSRIVQVYEKPEEFLQFVKDYISSNGLACPASQ